MKPIDLVAPGLPERVLEQLTAVAEAYGVTFGPSPVRLFISLRGEWRVLSAGLDGDRRLILAGRSLGLNASKLLTLFTLDAGGRPR